MVAPVSNVLTEFQSSRGSSLERCNALCWRSSSVRTPIYTIHHDMHDGYAPKGLSKLQRRPLQARPLFLFGSARLEITAWTRP